MKRNKDNYIYIPTDMRLKNQEYKVIYRRKYLDRVPKSLIYKLKKTLYQYILEYLSSRPLKKVAILNRAKAVIIDKKYARIYNMIANSYDEFEEREERKANDLKYNLITKLIKTGKLSIGLALSLFIVCSDPTLIGESEEIEYTDYTPYYTYETEENTLELTDEVITLANNKLSDVIANNNPRTTAMVYTNESLTNHFLSPEKQASFEYFVEEYANYFNLNAEYLIEVFKHATDNYSNINKILDDEHFDLTNPETVAILYVYYFSRNPEKYLGLDLGDYGIAHKSEFVTSEQIYIIEPNWMKNHEKISGVTKEDITLRNGLAYSEYVGRMCDLLGIPEEYKSYVLGVSYEERGQYGSDLSIYSNNMGGLKSDDGYFTYPSPEAGIISFVLNIRRYEWDYKINTLYDFGNRYDGDAFVDQWVSNVKSNHNKIANNYDTYFLTEDEENDYQNYISYRISNNNNDIEVIPLNARDNKSLRLDIIEE